MRNENLFAAAIEAAVVALRSTKAGVIAKHIIPRLFPKTVDAAEKEGGLVHFEAGVTAAIRLQIKAMPLIDADGQESFFKRYPKLFPFIQELSHGTYYTPNVDRYVSIFELCEQPELLDSARKYMRQKSKEIGDEADRLDDLYNAVMRSRRHGAKARDVVAEPPPLSPAE